MSDIVVATNPFKSSFERAFEQKIDVLYDDLSKIYAAKLVIFTGGADINPEIYNQKNTYSYFDVKRDEAELLALRFALKLDKKILGVCRGHQLVNAYLGGELVQDIWRDLNQYHGTGHKLVFTKQDSLIKRMFKKVNSLHHQGVTKAGKGLIPTSEHKGVIESCESKNVITVQFHPEFMTWSQEAGEFFKFINNWKES